jgi:hypothetical protein
VLQSTLDDCAVGALGYKKHFFAKEHDEMKHCYSVLVNIAEKSEQEAETNEK